MKKNFIIISIVLLFLSVCAFSNDGTSTKKDHLIKGVKYHPMLNGYCAITALRMNLDFIGIKVEQATLLNLGWDYGFCKYDFGNFSGAFPNTSPLEAIQSVSKIMGFSAQVKTHKSLEKAKKYLVKYISQDIPVLVQWVPHTVLAIGYKNNGESIIYHDPEVPASIITAPLKNKGKRGKGAFGTMKIAEWLKPPFSWAMFEYAMVVVKPGKTLKKINWSKVWERNANKTLGIEKNQLPAQYGIAGIKGLIKELKDKQNLNTKQKYNYLTTKFRYTFFLGVGFRRNAASFLAGQASTLNNPDLSSASRAFLESAHLYKAGKELFKWLKRNPQEVDKTLNGYVDILEKLYISEKKGAEYLLKAGKKVK